MEQGNYWLRARATRRRFVGGAGVGAAALAGAAAFGCGDDDDGGKKTATAAPGGATTASGSATAAARPSEQPKTGGTLTSSTAITDPPTFDPHVTAGFATRMPAGYVYSRLLGHKSGPGTDPGGPPIETDLATGYEVTDGGQTIVFKLRQDVKFQAPVSREMKASDVVFSYQRYIGAAPGSKASPNAGRFTQNIDSLTATDASTVVVKAKRPYFPLIDAFASPSYLFILPEAETGKMFDPATKMVGTGPFLLDAYKQGASFSFVPNREWFRIKERPIYMEKFVYPFVAVDQTVTQFLGKSLDYVARVAGADLVRVKQQIPDVQYWGAPVGASSLGFSSKDARFKDPRVRQAISMALDRDGIDETLFGLKALNGAGIKASMGWMNFCSPRNKDEWLDPKGKEIKPETAKLFKLDIAEGKKLLSAAGLGSGFEMKIAWPSNYAEPYRTEVELIAQMLAPLGIKATVDTQDYASQYVVKTYLGDFDNGAVLLSDGQSDPADYIELWFSGASPRNVSKVNDPEVDKQLAAVQAEFKTAERAKKLKDLQQYLDDKMYNVPIESSGGRIWQVTHPYIRNVADYPTSSTPYMYGWPSDGLPYWWRSS